ncbi:hypothetical protein AaE_010737 [Aphanomyces astaci]|uniref:Reverse transcriptase Ty1/copia-type domain-containing protein n=1 Tax=Aphanomyces astaci TaxID=112090 RepID=A0A6A4ZZS4_APHAT|nr:hypothetical protein AaE_010737 [Aphanomyces astaci]
MRFSMENSKPSPTPMEVNLKLSESMCPQDETELTYMVDKPYRFVVASITYLMISTRPDLAYTQQLSQFLTNPGPTHWEAAKRALRYIGGTIDYGLVLGGEHNVFTTPLHAFADSDYVDTRRCVFVTFYCNLRSRRHYAA